MLFLLNDGGWDKTKMQVFVADFTPSLVAFGFFAMELVALSKGKKEGTFLHTLCHISCNIRFSRILCSPFAPVLVLTGQRKWKDEGRFGSDERNTENTDGPLKPHFVPLFVPPPADKPMQCIFRLSFSFNTFIVLFQHYMERSCRLLPTISQSEGLSFWGFKYISDSETNGRILFYYHLSLIRSLLRWFVFRVIL
jgi:hypothetical protein